MGGKLAVFFFFFISLGRATFAFFLSSLYCGLWYLLSVIGFFRLFCDIPTPARCTVPLSVFVGCHETPRFPFAYRRDTGGCRSMVVTTISIIASFPPPAPAAVSDLRLLNNGSCDSLVAVWSLASGDVDSYLVSLTAMGSHHQDSVLPPGASSALFSGLTPGRAYQVSVSTSSGELSTESQAAGRTGRELPRMPLVVSS